MITDTCRSCGRPIRWCITAATGARIPVDVDHVPRERGNVVIRPGTGPDGADLALVLPLPERADHPGPFYLSHFVTCSNSAVHRKAR